MLIFKALSTLTRVAPILTDPVQLVSVDLQLSCYKFVQLLNSMKVSKFVTNYNEALPKCFYAVPCHFSCFSQLATQLLSCVQSFGAFTICDKGQETGAKQTTYDMSACHSYKVSSQSIGHLGAECGRRTRCL